MSWGLVPKTDIPVDTRLATHQHHRFRCRLRPVLDTRLGPHLHGYPLSQRQLGRQGGIAALVDGSLFWSGGSLLTGSGDLDVLNSDLFDVQPPRTVCRFLHAVRLCSLIRATHSDRVEMLTDIPLCSLISVITMSWVTG